MQRVLLFDRMVEAAADMHKEVFDYIREGQIESFESFEKFDLLAFNWYDVHSERTSESKIMIYLDGEDLFFFCEDEAAEQKVRAITEKKLGDTPETNERLVYYFFVQLLKGDMAYLNQFESDINDGEGEVLGGSQRDALLQIQLWRRELLRVKRYYEQLSAIFDEMSANDNRLLSHAAQGHLSILGNRVDRYLSEVRNLQDVVSQMREAYQSQMSIQQNELMKVFTVVTVIFLPLTLLTGWYGMNFLHMPELAWIHGYPAVICAAAAIVLVLIFIFKRRKWL